jgi:hypothetical protein
LAAVVDGVGDGACAEAAASDSKMAKANFIRFLQTWTQI